MEWISVKDKLPEIGSPVLVITDSGIIEGELTKDGSFDFITLYIHGCGCCADDKDMVSHWAPIPELPEEIKKYRAEEN